MPNGAISVMTLARCVGTAKSSGPLLGIGYRALVYKQNDCEIRRDSSMKKNPSISGLCMNCGDYEICKFPGFGKGILFCEEYNLQAPSEQNERCSERDYIDPTCIGIENLIPE
jgi:hypothetical protein